MISRIRTMACAAPLLVLIMVGVVCASTSHPSGHVTRDKAVLRNLVSAPLTFEVNRGQASPEVELLSRGAGYALFLSATGATLELRSAEASGAAEATAAAARAGGTPAPTVVRMRVAGASSQAKLRPEGELPTRSHYFIGGDPARWRADVPHFSRARCEDVYPGVDLVYYGNQRALEYDFVVNPGADPGQVRLAFEGAARLEIDRAGDLLIHTADGVLRQHRPLLYQERAGKRERLDGSYRLATADAGDLPLVEFEVPRFDASRPLVIDPVLSYASYIGGAGDDYGNGIAIGPDGVAWVTGHTSSVGFANAGATHRAAGGGMDAFVARVSPSGGLVSVTYLGGSGDDRGHHVFVNGDGHGFVVGETGSANFPTAAALQGTFGGFIDGFLTRLSPTGNSLVYSTYVGGRGDDRANSVWVDGAGVAYLTGLTTSTDFPTTAGALSTNLPSPNADAFVTAVGAAGNGFVFSTYLGGSDDDLGTDIVVDAAGSIFVSGDTSSEDFPVSAGAYQRTPGGGQHDVFVAKLNPGGAALNYATFVGGNSADRCAGLAVDARGNAYVTGFTNSTAFPTVNALQPVFGGGLGDAFVSMVNSTGSGLVYSTYLGGSSRDTGQGLVVEADGTAAVTGLTASANFPTTPNALAPVALGGGTDAYVTRIGPAGSQILFSSYLGGSGGDLALGIAVDGGDDLYICGATNSPNLGSGAFAGGQVDAFALRLGSASLPAPSDLQLSVVSGCQIDLTWQDNSTGEDAFTIERRTGGGAFTVVGIAAQNAQSYSDTGLAPLTAYTYRVRATSADASSQPSEEASASTPAGPAAPENLSATAVSGSRINLEWRDRSTDETGFVVERSTNGGFSFTQRDTVGPNVVSYSDLGLNPGTTYTYRVRSATAGGCSAASNEASATTFQSAPAAPRNLFAAAAGSSAVDLFWEDGSFNESGFRIERATGVGAFAEIHVTGPNAVAYSDSGLTAETEYRYRVRATNTGGDSGYSNIATVTTAAGAPAAPTQLAVETVSNSSLKVTWQHSGAGVTTFRIERALVGGGFTLASVVAGDQRSYTDSGLQSATTYRYRVQARGGGGDSPYSAEAAGATAGDPPAPPSTLAVTATGQESLVLTWHDHSDDESGFRIERRTVGGVFTQIAEVPANAVRFTDSGLTSETEYTYRLRAFNASGASAYSNEASAYTLLNRPADLAVETHSQTQLRLTWSDTSARETGTRIERSRDGVTFTEVAATGPNAVAYTDGGLLPATTYHYRIRYVGDGLPSEYTPPAEGTTLPMAPGAPFGLVVVAEEQQSLRLVWLDGSTNETGFVVERWLPEGRFALVSTTGAGVTTYTDTGLAADTSYTYRVKARNAGGDSNYSDEATARTLPSPPAAPSGLAVAPSGPGELSLTWSDHADNETAFYIERAEDGVTFVSLASVGADVTSYVDAGLPAGAVRTYRVRASNAGGDSAYSNAASGTASLAPPPAPTGLRAEILSVNTIRLIWTDNSGGQAQFRILRQPGGLSSNGAIGTAPTSTSTYVDGSVGADTAYVYSVVAFNGGGDSAPSNEVTVSIPTGGVLSVPKRSNFGKRKVGDTRIRSIRIRNRGRGELAGCVEAGSVTGPFRVLEGGGSFTLPRKGSRIVRVEFLPTAAGSFRSTLVITSTDPRRPRVEVTLVGKGK